MTEKIIQDEINKIIKSFYTKKGKVKREFGKKFKFDPINWGDLKCYDVKKKYVVYIDEADPDYCDKFKEYLRQEMKKKGYDVEIVTEW
jgi:hypothetical protein